MTTDTELVKKLRDGPGPSANLEAHLDKLEAIREEAADRLEALQAEKVKLRELVHLLGSRVTFIADELEDEGDRVYLASTNHAEQLREGRSLYDRYRWETDDMGADDALTTKAAQVSRLSLPSSAVTEALKFYADPASYEGLPPGLGFVPIDCDSGDKAREALSHLSTPPPAVTEGCVPKENWLPIAENYLAQNAAESGADVIISGLVHQAKDLRNLALDQGRIIRTLDEPGHHSELWTNDGDYIPDGRFA